MNKNVELSSKLGDLLNIPPISIELLPGDASEWVASVLPEHAPFLFIDDNLGVPYKLAYKAYLEAVPRFRAARNSPGSDADVLISSAVLLLVNPAHQTALNARKRLVLRGTLLAKHDLRLMDALLTLREGAKQSILWHHRRWLLRRVFPLASSLPSMGDGVDTLHGVALDAEAFRAEIAVVERACETYPRNYHGWAHRFLCAEALVALLPPSPSPASAFAFELKEERARIRAWIERHVSDYSAMQYACRLEVLLQSAPSRPLYALADTRPGSLASPTETGKATDEGPFAHALELVRTYPSHEALWLYLRWAVELFPSPEGEDWDLTELTEKHLTLGSSGGITAVSRFEPDAHAHAVRFAAWRARLLKGRGVEATTVRTIAAAAEGEVRVASEAALLSCLHLDG